jgi:flagellar hook-basal body complex protein FliE
MPAPITAISSPIPVDPIRPAGQTSGGGFQDVLTNAIQKVQGVQQDASASVERFLSGEGEELHSTVMATTRAELAFDLFVQTRNKVVSAYQEIMRMQM